jgi:hypothetical protein
MVDILKPAYDINKWMEIRSRLMTNEIWMCLQVKDVLFEPVRKTQDAMHFKKVTTKEGEEMWMPCGPREPNAKQTTMIELASAGLAAQVNKALTLEHSNFLIFICKILRSFCQS